MGDLEVPISLSTICGGDLEKRFQDVYPNILAAIREGEKATIGITLEFKRIPETSTVAVGFKMAPHFPAQGRSSICQVTADNKLKTDKPVPQTEQIVLKMPVESAS